MSRILNGVNRVMRLLMGPLAVGVVIIVLFMAATIVVAFLG